MEAMSQRFNDPTDEEVQVVIDFFMEQMSLLSMGQLPEEMENGIREMLSSATTMEEL